MLDDTLEQLRVELDAALAGDSLSPTDRQLFQRLRDDLAAARQQRAPAASSPSAGPASAAAQSAGSQLRESVSSAIERLENNHPWLTTLLGKTLDTLRDLGV